ncbi:unnamed protein product [Acanthocheilonema viteae]|uniref:Uncharacterized protein n=1 Tax=Acanthocheilonema viteae TaxID=6277 RepID=A0A498T038_ACAVI|nr:unnamed protein product [Acanthocheilonema viteae]
MEIHHRLYEKSINYNSATTIDTANDLVPILCDANDTSGIPENSNFGPSTSSLINNTDAFVLLPRTATANINEFPGYSNTSSTGLLNHQTTSNLSLDLTSQAISVIAETSNEAKNDLNTNSHHHHHHYHHQCQQQQQQFRRTLALQNAENNICAIVGTLTTASLQTDQTNTTMIITANRTTNNRCNSNNENDDANGSNSNSNCNCPITTTNEPNFSQRISKICFGISL